MQCIKILIQLDLFLFCSHGNAYVFALEIWRCQNGSAGNYEMSEWRSCQTVHETSYFYSLYSNCQIPNVDRHVTYRTTISVHSSNIHSQFLFPKHFVSEKFNRKPFIIANCECVCVCVRAEKISKMQRQNDSNGQNVDESFEVKTYFYIGAYQQCLNEINKLRVIFFHFEHRFLMGPHFNQYKSIAGQQFAKGLFYVACIYCTT